MSAYPRVQTEAWPTLTSCSLFCAAAFQDAIGNQRSILATVFSPWAVAPTLSCLRTHPVLLAQSEPFEWPWWCQFCYISRSWTTFSSWGEWDSESDGGIKIADQWTGGWAAYSWEERERKSLERVSLNWWSCKITIWGFVLRIDSIVQRGTSGRLDQMLRGTSKTGTARAGTSSSTKTDSSEKCQACT